VPDRIEFDLKSEAKNIEIGKPAQVSVDGRYLYGAPAAGLNLEGEVSLKTTRDNADYPNYLFGLADEQASEDTKVPLDDLQPVDEQGHETFDVNIADAPATTQLLNANITIRMQEAGGRAVERSLTLPIKAQGPMIGIKPEFSGDLAENSIGKFHVIALDKDYQWYRDGSSWKFEPVTSTKQVANGSIDATTDGAEISVPVTWGRYRLEIDRNRHGDRRRPDVECRVRGGLLCCIDIHRDPRWPGRRPRQGKLCCR
jgi:alpha-2-macroglobulin